ncbi:MAG: class I tRNA ligase family protein, partial [Candidatus Zambryskibacteria bacterium]
IKKVTKDIEQYKFNTAIAEFMKFVGTDGLFREKPEDQQRVRETFLKLLAPFAPHMTEEIWHELGNKKSIHLEGWPKFDESKIKEESTIIVVQINGKVRAQFEAQAGMGEKEAKEKALSLPEVQKWFDGKETKKVIFVPNKVINFVI